MTEDALIILCLKIVLITGVASITTFATCYSRWAAWWSNAIGRTLVIKDILLIAVMSLSILSLFFKFNRLTSHIAAWLDIAILGAITPVMVWRTVVFWKIHRDGRPAAWPLPVLLAGRHLRGRAARLRRRPGAEPPAGPGA